jgi:hypothetical protein
LLIPRENDKPEAGKYVSRAREAIEDGLYIEGQSGDKQSGDGMIAVPLEDLEQSLELVQEIKILYGEEHVAKPVSQLEQTLKSIIK